MAAAAPSPRRSTSPHRPASPCHTDSLRRLSHVLPSSFPLNHPLDECRIVYFEGYPQGWLAPDLQRVFKKYGVLGTISIARKHNAKRLCFGFLRTHQNLRFVLSRLSSINIGSFRIKAYLAKYPSLLPRPIKTAQKLPESTQLKIFKPSTRDNRSYAAVTCGAVDNREKWKFNYNISNTKPTWFSSACMIRVKNMHVIPALESLIANRGFSINFYAPIGGPRVVVCFNSQETRKGFMEEGWLSLSDVLASVEFLDEDFIPTEFLTWVDFYGIPLSMITAEFLHFLCSKIGKLIVLDTDMEKPIRLDVISCLLSVPYGGNGNRMTIVIAEKEVEIEWRLHPLYCTSDEDSIPGPDAKCPSSINFIKAPISKSQQIEGPKMHKIADADAHELQQHFRHDSKEFSVSMIPETDPSVIQVLDKSPTIHPAGHVEEKPAAVVQELPHHLRHKRKGRKGKENSKLGSSVSLGSLGTDSLDISNRNKVLCQQASDESQPQEFNKAEASWQVGKLIGLFADQHQAAVIQKLKEIDCA